MLVQLWIVVQLGHSHYQGDQGESPDLMVLLTVTDFVVLRKVVRSDSNFDYDGFTNVPHVPFGTLLTFLLL